MIDIIVGCTVVPSSIIIIVGRTVVPSLIDIIVNCIVGGTVGRSVVPSDPCPPPPRLLSVYCRPSSIDIIVGCTVVPSSSSIIIVGVLSWLLD